MIRMKAILFQFGILLLMLSMNSAIAQELSPVKWQFEYNSDSSQLVFTAEIEEGWHLYASELESDEGPLPTEFIFNELKGVELGELIEEKGKTDYDPNFDMTIKFFEKRVDFKFPVKSSDKNAEVSGIVSYMVCDDEKCLPPVDVDFKVEISK